jgi:hypothetical protein
MVIVICAAAALLLSLWLLLLLGTNHHRQLGAKVLVDLMRELRTTSRWNMDGKAPTIHSMIELINVECIN